MRPLAVLLLASVAATALAQNYPSHPVRIVIPLSPGGTTDVPGRMVAQKLSETLGQQFFVENKAGAGGLIGSDFVAKSKPDGYTLLLTASPFVISPHVYKNMPYNALTHCGHSLDNQRRIRSLQLPEANHTNPNDH